MLRRRRRDEKGAVAVIVALSMTGLLVATGLVVNLGLARTDKLTNKAHADAASAAGIRAADLGDGTTHPFLGVCTAFAYLRTNDPDLASTTTSWKTGAGQSLAGDPCAAGSSLLTATCTADAPNTWAWLSGTSVGPSASDGDVTFEIRSGYSTPDPGFDAAGTADNSAQGGCDQLAVIIREGRDAGFGSSATGGSDITTAVRSVGRTIPGSGVAPVPALLMLERHACSALAISGINAKVDVLGNGTTPGTIHADSLGDTCTSGGKVLLGGSAGRILARKAETGTLSGVITTTALSGLTGSVPANASDGAANVCAQQSSGTCAAATGSGIVGRAPVDRRYSVGVRAALALAAVQYGKTTNFGQTSRGVTYTVFTCNNVTSSNASAIFVNCPAGATLSGQSVSFPNATDVVFNGKLSVQTPKLFMPNVVRLYVKGATGNGMSIAGNGTIELNTGGATSCAGNTPLTAAQLVVGNGPLTAAGNASLHLCRTTVLMADNTGNGCALPTSAVGTGAAPYDNPCGGSISFSGNGAVDWTAPNLTASTPVNWDSLEDLAFWTETSAGNAITGNGSLQASGVFFLPNANPLSIGGNGAQTSGADAQIVARRLVVSGNGTLYLRPAPADAVPIPLPPTFALVR